MENSERTLCTLSHLEWEQVLDIVSGSELEIYGYPTFMKLHPSLITYLSNEHGPPLVWSNTLRKHQFRKEGTLQDDEDHRAQGFLLSIQFSPLTVETEDSLRSTVNGLLHSYSLTTRSYPRSHSPVWERVVEQHYQDQQFISCELPSSIELSFSSHGVELNDLRDISTSCLVHLIHHVVEDPAVISIAIHHRPTLMNYEARGLTQSGHIYVEPYREAGLTGEGQVCGVGDSGVNDISCFFLDDSKAYPTVTTSRNGELQPLRRKIIQYVAYADSSEDEAGHGTHVSGSVGIHRYLSLSWLIEHSG